MYRILKLNESTLNEADSKTVKEYRIIDTGDNNKVLKTFKAEDYEKGYNEMREMGKKLKEEGKEDNLIYKEFTVKSNLTEAPDEEEIEQDIEDNVEANEELEDTIDSEENQEENPVKEDSDLDVKLDELREVLVDLDLNLYRIASKEDPNNVIYVIGKVAEESNDVLMLIDTEPEEINEPEIEEPIMNDITIDEEVKEDSEEVVEEPEEEELKTPEQRFDFIVLPKSFDEINKLNPRYGEELTPDHEAIMDYLMNCLIEVNPEAAEELQKDDAEEDLPVPTNPEDIDLDINIDGEEDLEDED